MNKPTACQYLADRPVMDDYNAQVDLTLSAYVLGAWNGDEDDEDDDEQDWTDEMVKDVEVDISRPLRDEKEMIPDITDIKKGKDGARSRGGFRTRATRA